MELTDTELRMVVGGLEQAGPDVDEAGPDEADGNNNQDGQPGNVDEAGADE